MYIGRRPLVSVTEPSGELVGFGSAFQDYSISLASGTLLERGDEEPERETMKLFPHVLSFPSAQFKTCNTPCFMFTSNPTRRKCSSMLFHLAFCLSLAIWPATKRISHVAAIQIGILSLDGQFPPSSRFALLEV
jgi:hypothetical protein